mmetsp:Transcript_170173/g.545738  ORF Transcript_170173/g.545738 Transcript_170173/m.545738 type:complete len:206 (+) Transcript_170173:306-923(+)
MMQSEEISSSICLGGHFEVSIPIARAALHFTSSSPLLRSPARSGTQPASTTSLTCGPPTARTSTNIEQLSRWIVGSSRSNISLRAGTGSQTKIAIMPSLLPVEIFCAARTANDCTSLDGCSINSTSCVQTPNFTTVAMRSGALYCKQASARQVSATTSSSGDITSTSRVCNNGCIASPSTGSDSPAHRRPKQRATARTTPTGCSD